MEIKDLSLKEKLFILSLGNNGYTATQFLGFGLAGAGILELIEPGKATENDQLLMLKNSKHTQDPLLDYFIDTIYKSKRYRKIKYWVTRLGKRPRCNDCCTLEMQFMVIKIL